MKYGILSLFTLLALFASAENISQDKARKMALEFFRQNRPQLGVTDLRMVHDGETEKSRANGAVSAFYVFDNPDGKGFVILAGDDIASPVLGYSYENDFPQGNLPEQIDGWLNNLKRQINDGRNQGMKPLSGSRGLSGMGEVVVQLKTAQWNQHAPYNLYSPTIDGELAPTGCTITAGAIVMKYHQWPEKGTGTLPGYTTTTRKIKMPAIELTHTYKWSDMLDEYKSGEYTSSQGEQVARLMADIGTMLQANYDKYATASSSAYLADYLPVYMGYDKSALYRNRHNYTDQSWHELLMKELQENRPVIYDGFNASVGHSFVLDGYTSDQYYSVNWGWGGYCNGYFLLNALVPEGSGTGGNNDHYNFNQSAVTGLMPDQGGDYLEIIGLGEKGLTASTEEFERYRSFQLATDWIGNKGGAAFNGTILWALADREGKIKEELAKLNVSQLNPRWGFPEYKQICTITVPIEIGDRIRVYFKGEKTPEWTLVEGGNECVWELFVADEFSIDETTSIRFQKESRIVVVQTKDGVSLKFRNEQGKDLDDLCQTVGNETTIQTEGLPAGRYVLKLEKSFEKRELRIRLGEKSQE